MLLSLGVALRDALNHWDVIDIGLCIFGWLIIDVHRDRRIIVIDHTDVSR